MRITQRTGIGRSLKNRPPFGKFSDLRVTTGPRRFSKTFGSGGRKRKGGEKENEDKFEGSKHGRHHAVWVATLHRQALVVD